MNVDISRILNDWPYRPGSVTVRKILGQDGKEKIQLRLDLGLLQMEATGRPDGLRPHGCESYLDYYEQKLAEHVLAHGTDEGFELDKEACDLLRAEALMYYHRYLAAFVLGSYETVIEDTQRNLRAFELCEAYAAQDPDRKMLQDYRPYVMMMNARAAAHLALKAKRMSEALERLREGISRIERFYQDSGRPDDVEHCGEIAVLREMAKDIGRRAPVDPIERLKRRLAEAVRQERYEEAAVLRDEIRRAQGEPRRDP